MRFERWHLAGRSGFHSFRRRSKASGAFLRGRPRCRSTVIGINLLSVELAYLLSQGGIGETPGLWHSGYLKKAPEAGDGSPFGRFAFRTLHQSCLMSMTCALRFTNSRRLSFLMWAPSGRGRPPMARRVYRFCFFDAARRSASAAAILRAVRSRS